MASGGVNAPAVRIDSSSAVPVVDPIAVIGTGMIDSGVVLSVISYMLVPFLMTRLKVCDVGLVYSSTMLFGLSLIHLFVVVSG